MPELLERLTSEIGQLVTKVHILNTEIEKLNAENDRLTKELAKANKTGDVDVREPKKRQRANAKDKTENGAQAQTSV